MNAAKLQQPVTRISTKVMRIARGDRILKLQGKRAQNQIPLFSKCPSAEFCTCSPFQASRSAKACDASHRAFDAAFCVCLTQNASHPAFDSAALFSTRIPLYRAFNSASVCLTQSVASTFNSAALCLTQNAPHRAFNSPAAFST